MSNAAAPSKTDRWCANCARMVAPKRTVPVLAWVYGILAGGLTYAFVHFGNSILAAWDWAVAGLVMGLITGGRGATNPELTCPICTSDNLRDAEPALDVPNGPIGFLPHHR